MKKLHRLKLIKRIIAREFLILLFGSLVLLGTFLIEKTWEESKNSNRIELQTRLKSLESLEFYPARLRVLNFLKSNTDYIDENFEDDLSFLESLNA